jgi:hypothetical protein
MGGLICSGQDFGGHGGGLSIIIIIHGGGESSPVPAKILPAKILHAANQAPHKIEGLPQPEAHTTTSELLLPSSEIRKLLKIEV